MTNRTYISIGILVIFAIGSFLIIKNYKKEGTLINIPPITLPTDTSLNLNDNTVYLEWGIKNLPDGEYGEPYEDISLNLSGVVQQVISLGKFSGCSITGEPVIQDAAPNSVTSMYCWWAGAGDMLDARWDKEKNNLLIYHQELGETEDGVQPAPVLVQTIAMPKDADVELK